LQAFLRKHRFQSVVDMGCGDWQFSRLIDWSGISYQGFDVVSSVITSNRAQFSSSSVSFNLYSGNGDELPSADLLIVKDVLQHLSNKNIAAFLPNTRKYKYCLITNCVNPNGETTNTDIEDGGFRYLDLRLPPFSVDAEEVLSFANHRPSIVSLFTKPRWKKKVLLLPQKSALTELPPA
jgi:2-polyprenyl-3-methyl-5-hydroxy-6-metoxy-1,4-benzoquinol methylase